MKGGRGQRRRLRAGHAALATVVLAGGLLAMSSTVWAQDRETMAGPATGPEWSDLSPEQQRVLAPYRQEWESMSPGRRSSGR